MARATSVGCATVLAATAISATAAQGCPFCSSGTSATGPGYRLATLLMLVLPLCLFGGFLYLIRRSPLRDRPSDSQAQEEPRDAA